MFTPSVSGRLRLLALLLAATAGVLWTARAADDEKETKLSEKELAALIDQLGDDDEDKRAAAEKKLMEHSEQAHPAVLEASKKHADADVRLRATLLARKLGKGRLLVGHKSTVRCILVSKDGKRAYTCGEDKTIRVWNLRSGKELKQLDGHTGFTWQIGLSGDEKELISSGGPDKTLRLWNLEKGEEVKKYSGFPIRVYAAAISPDGKYVVGGEGGVGANDEKGDPDDAKFDVRLFDKETGKLVHQMKGHTGYVWRAAFSPDSKKVATVGMNDSSFRIWDVETGKALVDKQDAHEKSWVTDVLFTSDGKTLITCARDNKVKFWDAEKGTLNKTYDLGEECEAMALSKDGKRLLVAEGKYATLLDTATGKVLYRFEGHEDTVTAVALLPDGEKALSAGKDKTLRLWTLPK